MRSSERLGARSSILASRHPSDVPTRFTAVTLQSASRRASNAPFHFVCRFERSPRGRNFPPVREFRHAFPFFFFPPLFFLSTCNCCVGNISLCDQTCVKRVVLSKVRTNVEIIRNTFLPSHLLQFHLYDVSYVFLRFSRKTESNRKNSTRRGNVRNAGDASTASNSDSVDRRIVSYPSCDSSRGCQTVQTPELILFRWESIR